MNGITFEKDVRGKRRYARIDLRKYGNNDLLEDFLDGECARLHVNDEFVDWNEVVKKLDSLHGI